MGARDAGVVAPCLVRNRFAIAAGIVLLTAAIFWRIVELPFIGFDDPQYVLLNGPVLRGLTAHSFAWALTATHAANWHPLTWLSHMLDVSLFGLDPAGHHATNLVLHCANAVLVFALFVRMTAAPWRSALVAALFALHPLRVESVAWVAERKDLLAGLLWLATMHAYVSWVRAPSARRYALLVGAFVLGLAAKPMLVTLPCALLLLDAWPLGRIDLSAFSLRTAWPLVREKWPLFALAAASSVLTVAVQSSWGAMRALQHVTLAERLANAAFALASYVQKTAWPSSLAVFYPFPPSAPPIGALVAVLAVLVGCTALAWSLRIGHPFVLVGWLWFVGTLVPVIGIVQVGNQAMADRYTYLPSIGLAAVAAWALPGARRTMALVATSAALVVVLLGAVTVRQIGFWRTEQALFEHAERVTDSNWLAETVIGMTLERKGDVAGAIVRYRRALAIRPDAPEALHNLGNVLIARGERREGIALLREAVRLWPGYVSALAGLGVALAEQGELEEGVRMLRAAAARAPGSAPIRYDYALVLLDAGAREQALSEFEAVLRLSPGDVEARAQVERLRASRGE